MSDAEILTEILRGVYGPNNRRKMVVEWGALLGLSAPDALRLACDTGLLPSSHPPRTPGS